MTVNQALKGLYALHRFGIKPGLERTLHLLDCVGNPHRDLRTIHVAGTNGKGSVCSMLASVLINHGCRVGLYTSPHILSFRERIQVNGTLISNEDIARLYEQIEPFISATEATFFEVTTAMALLYFREQQVECAVLETGMGGRFDSTNVVHPLVSIVTSVDLDHQEYLGNTLEKICFEKAGVIKKLVPFINGERRSELKQMLQQIARDFDAPFIQADSEFEVELIDIDESLDMNLRWRELGGEFRTVHLPLSGMHQLRNVACVLAALRVLREVYGIRDDAIADGLARLRDYTNIKARIQLLESRPPLVVDVGHNVACMQQLVETLGLSTFKHLRWNIVFGVMIEKDIRQMLEILQPICAHLYCCHPQLERARSSTDIFEHARQLSIPATDSHSVRAALMSARADHEPTLVCGSFYLVEEALTALGISAN